jgi:energy-coupling factor transporter ATP-binding protein EcfA2
VLKKIRLKNFKLHEDTSIEASRITVFIGPNNSGKSSIFQALLLLRQAISRKGIYLVGPGPRRSFATPDNPFLYASDVVADVGEFRNVVREGSREVQIGVDGGLPPRDRMDAVISRAGPLQLGFDVHVQDDALVKHEGWIECKYGYVPWKFSSSSTEWKRDGYDFDRSRVRARPAQSFQLVEAFPAEPVPDSERRDVNALSAYLGGALEALMASLRPVFPLRGFEERGYPLPEKKPGAIDLLSLSDRAVALSALLAYDRDTEEKISGILAEVLKIRVKVRLVEGKRATVWAEPADKTRSETLFLNQGTGANQLPFILVPIALAASGDSILLAEPEAHLHPRLQSELTGMLLRLFQFAGGELQFFIETHSEHVLHRLLHAVAKGELSRDDLTIYYFPEPKEARADPRKLKIDEQGGVEGGLPGFFDQSLDELTEYLEALKQPKK